jgi:hypothetical protein
MAAKKAVKTKGENLNAAGPIIQQLQPHLKRLAENPPEPPMVRAGSSFILSNKTGMMMNSWLNKSLVQLLLAFAAGALFLFGGINQTASAQALHRDPRLIARAEQITGDRFSIYTETANGAHVYAVSRPSEEALRAIDSGLTELFNISRRHGYRARLNYTDYTVFIARPDRTKDSAGAYSPDIAVGAAQYAGSVYDKGGYVYAAGMVLAYNPCSFIIAEHERDFGRVSNAVRYEGEHLVLYYNDRPLYERTRDHSKGGGHPILQ